MHSLVIFATLFITLGVFVIMLTMRAGVLSSASRRNAAPARPRDSAGTPTIFPLRDAGVPASARVHGLEEDTRGSERSVLDAEAVYARAPQGERPVDMAEKVLERDASIFL